MQKSKVSSSTKLVRALAICMASFMPVFMSFFSGGMVKEVMVFYVGDLTPFLEGTHTAQAATISGLKGPSTCTGTNAAADGIGYSQPPSQTGSRSYCYGVYNCPPGGGVGDTLAGANPPTGSNVQTCVNPVTGNNMSSGMTCSVGTHITGYGTLEGRDIPSNIMPCSCQGLTAFGACTGLERGHRMAGIGAYIVNGCHTEYSWDPEGHASAKQKCEQYFDATTNTVNYQGVPIANANGTPLGSGGTTGSANRATPIVREITGRIESATKERIVGWALDPEHLSSPLSLHVYRKAPASSTGQIINIQPTIVANIARPDLVTKLSLPSGEAVTNHGFSFVTPTEFQDGDTVIIYAISSSGAWNPSIGEKVIGSTDSVTPTQPLYTTTPATGTGTSTSTNSTTAAIVPGTAPRNWAEWENACRTSNAGVCVIPTGGGGPQCVIGRGDGAQAERDFCEAMYNSCGGGNRGGTITGLCDPGRYNECREDSRFVDSFGRVLTQECDAYLLNACDVAENGSPGDAANCRPECVLNDNNDTTTGVPRPSDCPGTVLNPPPAATPPPNLNPCDLVGGNPNTCTAPPRQPTPPRPQ